ncbi:MAG: 5'-nucleotidase C-terminal domain-containing protein [Candidatus Symbiothrix sp.]|jgi:2',3'-cyclic-nucleotide 2'-phosphodiesterase (5'-nucleotidase family)|nr:5'-nucleotidase C-terminal domain-containing protein [Candidatus Symbiothrix sp.]
MKRIRNTGIVLALIAYGAACSSPHYTVQSVTDTKIVMDSTWATAAGADMEEVVAYFQQHLKAETSVVIGTSKQTLTKGFPQSLLSNFAADAMQQLAEERWQTVDFSVLNMGGLRTSINKGAITVGNIYEVFPFENKLVLVEMRGSAVRELFEAFALKGGQGVSSTVRFVIKNQALSSLSIRGKALEDNRIYRVATVDYLADGNDGMDAFLQADQRRNSHETFRALMLRYIQSLTNKNQEIDAKIDHRITVIH